MTAKNPGYGCKFIRFVKFQICSTYSCWTKCFFSYGVYIYRILKNTNSHVWQIESIFHQNCPSNLFKLIKMDREIFLTLTKKKWTPNVGSPLASFTYLYFESISEVPIKLLCSPKIFFSTLRTFINPSGRNSFKLKKTYCN